LAPRYNLQRTGLGEDALMLSRVDPFSFLRLDMSWSRLFECLIVTFLLLASRMFIEVRIASTVSNQVPPTGFRADARGRRRKRRPPRSSLVKDMIDPLSITTSSRPRRRMLAKESYLIYVKNAVATGSDNPYRHKACG
jgi:hypothetical protein